MVTLGVEEEYLLLDDGTGLPAARASRVRAAADREAGLAEGEVDNELLQAQVEVATPVCEDLAEVAAHLARFRRAVSAAARRTGCRVVATGAAPVADREPVPVTEKPRYHAMRAQAAHLVDEQLINGMHIHVAIPDRSAGAAALGRLRPWLPALVALGANSPFWDGLDTGFASWRTVVFGRWPVSGVPPYARDAADYDATLERLLATGVMREPHQAYWHARLSDRYPTLEVRAPDVQLDVPDAVTIAGLTRALVTTALREADTGTPPLIPPHEIVRAAGWHAARHGLGGDLVDPVSGEPAPAGAVVAALLAYVGPALDEAGDADRVTSGVRRILAEGTGAVRQRHALADAGFAGLLELVAAEPATADVAGPATADAGTVSRPA
ncbi:carboxylate-amine ligase [Actinacidiphila alni]|uniref:carboxylate-amine ligase n=1 Tax=Actinacidiphila alni TaxID=380248 RepID=UPI003456C894